MWTPTTRRQHSRDHLRYETDLTDAEWTIIEPMLPAPLEEGRPAKWSLREIVNAIFYNPLRQLAAAIEARWVCEQAHQQLKEELGLDHFEGRSWPGLHRHALMTMLAYAFLQSCRLKAAGRKKESADRPATDPAGHQAGDPVDRLARPPPTQCPHCHRPLTTHGEATLPK